MADESTATKISSIKRLYFAGHHFTRDLIGNVAPITAASLAFVSLYPPARRLSLTMLDGTVVNMSFWGFALVIVVYIVCAYFVGAIANIIGNFLHRILQKLPKLGKKSSYNYWYKENSADIDALYQKFFPDYQFLMVGAAVTPTDKINVLKEYFRANNPGGYVETYRQFLKVDLVRTSLLYSLLIAFFAVTRVFTEGFSVYIVFTILACLALSAILTFGELPRRVRKVVRAEYQFILATAQLKQDAEKRAARK